MKAIMRNEREMKDSGVKWIGEIPSKWETRPVKALFSLTTGFTPDSKNEELYDENGLTWVTIGDMNNDVIFDSRQKISSKVAAQHAKEMTPKGALMYSFKLSVGNVAFAGKDLFTNEAIASFVPKANDGDLHFLKYASSLIIGNATTNIYGAKIMNQKLILNAPISLPESIIEQQLIANYLDDRCSKIDTIIAEAKSSIEEYKELKQAVIYEAVTKGLDKNVEMKDSGVEFIGKIPVGWSVVKLKWLCDSITDGTHFSPELVSDGMPYVTAGDIHGIGIDFSKTRNISFEDYEKLKAQGCQPHKDDVLIVKDGATTGRVGLMNEEIECVTLSSVAMLKHNHRTIPKYLMYLMESEVLQFQIRKSMAGSAMPRTTLTKLMNYFSILCPLEAQINIIDYLDSKIEKIDEMISEKQSLIEDLEAYKKSLIYEVVTGKRKVVA